MSVNKKVGVSEWHIKPSTCTSLAKLTPRAEIPNKSTTTTNGVNSEIGIAGFCDNPLLSDIKFIVAAANGEGREKIFHGHKVLFGSKSPVFLAMFTSDIAIVNNEVKITDIEPKIFELFMKYIYEGGTEFLKELNIDALVNLTYAATKYLVKDLAQNCSILIVEILREKLNVENILTYWKWFICTIPDTAAMSFVEEYLDIHAEDILNTTHFFGLSCNELRRLLARDSLNITQEVRVFEAVRRWARRQCAKDELAWTKENLRAKLGSAIYQVRLATMDFYTFCDTVCPRNLLFKMEVQDILSYMQSFISNKRKSAVACGAFNCKQRTSTKDNLKRPASSRPGSDNNFLGFTPAPGTYETEFPLPFKQIRVSVCESDPGGTRTRIVFHYDGPNQPQP